MGERLDFLPKKIDKDSKEIADLTAKIEEAQKTMASLRSELTARRDSSTDPGNQTASRLAMKPTEAGAIASGHEDDVTMQALLTPGVELFQEEAVQGGKRGIQQPCTGQSPKTLASGTTPRLLVGSRPETGKAKPSGW